jgi:hypothetical protein
MAAWLRFSSEEAGETRYMTRANDPILAKLEKIEAELAKLRRRLEES